MISLIQKNRAYEVLRAAGFEPALARELLAGPKGLRDEFAGQAMAGLLAANATYSGKTTERYKLAADAYAHADAMMLARAETP